MDNNVLFVDDEVQILNAIRRAVRDETFTAIFANSGEEALHIMAEKEIKVLVTDMRMPGMTGLDLLKAVKVNYPDMIKIVLSGYTQLSQIMATINQGDIFRFIAKPWNSKEDLIASVEQGLEYYNIRKERAELEKNLEKRNKAYQNILKTMNDKFDYLNKSIKVIRTINDAMFEKLANEFSWQGSAGLRGYQLTLFRHIQALYLETMLISPKAFTLEEYMGALQRCCNQRFTVKLAGDLGHKQLKFFGNFKLIIGVIELFATQGNQQMLNEHQDVTITLFANEERLLTSIRWSEMSQLSDWLQKIAPVLEFVRGLLQESGIGIELSYEDGQERSIEMTIMVLEQSI